MRFILLVLGLFIINAAKAQQSSISVKVQRQSLSVNLEDDNSEKYLVLNKNKIAKSDKFIIYNSDKAEAKTWKRTFTIVDEADKEIVKFPAAIKGQTFQLPVTQVLNKLKKDNRYFLYTIAIPADPNRTAVVRVRRVLVCKIEVK